jgi:hypothetical protein
LKIKLAPTGMLGLPRYGNRSRSHSDRFRPYQARPAIGQRQSMVISNLHYFQCDQSPDGHDFSHPPPPYPPHPIYDERGWSTGDEVQQAYDRGTDGCQYATLGQEVVERKPRIHNMSSDGSPAPSAAAEEPTEHKMHPPPPKERRFKLSR